MLSFWHHIVLFYSKTVLMNRFEVMRTAKCVASGQLYSIGSISGCCSAK